MANKTMANMSHAEFEALVEQFIERGEDKVTLPTFLQVMADVAERRKPRGWEMNEMEVKRMGAQVTPYQDRLMEEVRTLNPQQMKKVLEFVTELKQGQTEDTLLEMLGQPGVSPEAIEQVYERLRQNRPSPPPMLEAMPPSIGISLNLLKIPNSGLVASPLCFSSIATAQPLLCFLNCWRELIYDKARESS